MDNTIPIPSYNELITLLPRVPPSQAHGLLCGYICGAMNSKDRYAWESLLFNDQDDNVREALRQLFEHSYRQLTEFSMEFGLVLPDDEAEINTRAENLGLWCQGFLTGLEQSGVPIQGRDDSEVTEAINDLLEISQVNFGNIASNDEDETAYVELVEYVRLSILMIYHELKILNQPPISAGKESLH